MKTVGCFRNTAEAHLAKSRLESKGIHALVLDENQPEGEGAAWPSDGVKVVVRAEDAERAMRVLAGEDSDPEDSDPEDSDPEDSDPEDSDPGGHDAHSA